MEQHGCTVHFPGSLYSMCPEIARVSHLHATGPLGSSLCLSPTILSICPSLSVFWYSGSRSLFRSLFLSNSAFLPYICSYLGTLSCHGLYLSSDSTGSRTPANCELLFLHSLPCFLFVCRLYAFSSFPTEFLLLQLVTLPHQFPLV